MSDIHLHIDRLVLDGLPVSAADGPAVHAAITAELARLLGESGLGAGFRQGGALAYVRGPELRLPPAPGPEPLGRQIGAAIHRSLCP